MHDVDLLVPFARVESSLAKELWGDATWTTRLPHLARLLRSADVVETTILPDCSPLEPWQCWAFVRRAFDNGDGWAAHIEHVNVAELWAMACGLSPRRGGGRWLVEPAHFVIARDHLRLEDPSHLTYDIEEARALAAAAEPALNDAGWSLAAIEPTTARHWFVERDDRIDLAGPAVEQAIDDNVALWQPRASTTTRDASTGAGDHDAALDWRRCVNEIQMLWHVHPVNDAREQRGERAINAVWLSGNGQLHAPLPRYRAVASTLRLASALPVVADAARVLETFDALIEPGRREAWDAWRDRWPALDERLGALVRAQHDGEVGSLSLVLCGRRSLMHVCVKPRSSRPDVGRSVRRLMRRLGLAGRGSIAEPTLVDASTDDALERVA